MNTLSEDTKIGMAVLTFLPLGLGSAIGPLIMGEIQDRFGNKFSIFFIISNILVTGSLLIYINELCVFDKIKANIFMFFFGCVDNCASSYICVALGFEFKSKIVPFGAKNFIENLSIFFIFLCFSIFQIDN